MLLMAIAHHAEDMTGMARLTYEDFERVTGKSREKIARGLDVLNEHNLVEVNTDGRSTYRLADYDITGGWGKLPCRKLYSIGCIEAFNYFHLRSKVELDALKFYYLFAAFRDNNNNHAFISFDKIVDYTGTPRNRIKQATSFLVSSGLIYIERFPSEESDHGIKYAYRLAHLDSYNHMGTKGRRQIAVENVSL